MSAAGMYARIGASLSIMTPLSASGTVQLGKQIRNQTVAKSGGLAYYSNQEVAYVYCDDRPYREEDSAARPSRTRVAGARRRRGIRPVVRREVRWPVHARCSPTRRHRPDQG